MSESIYIDPLKNSDGNGHCAGVTNAIVLKESLSIGDVRELYEILSYAIKQEKQVQIDAGKVEKVDASILQLMLAFQKEIAAREGALHWKAISASLRQAARVLGMKELITSWE